MTPEDLDAIEKRAEAATKGPWEWHGTATTVPNKRRVMLRFLDGDRPTGIPISAPNSSIAPQSDDATFIEHARADVPALVAEVRRLRAALHRIGYEPYEPAEASDLEVLYAIVRDARAALGEGTKGEEK